MMMSHPETINEAQELHNFHMAPFYENFLW